MKLVERQIVKRTDKRYKDLLELCHLSKNLYNVVLYTIRQHYFNTVNDDTVKRKFLNYYDVWNLLKKDNPDYKALEYHSAQLVIKQVEQDFRSFFSLLKLKQQGAYSKRVKLPKYKDKAGYNVVCFNQFKKRELDKGIVCLPRSDLKFHVQNRNVNFISVVPKNDYIQVNFIYGKDEKEQKSDNGRYMAVDLGVDNLATCTSNVVRSFIVDGRKVKHVNQFYNKKMAEAKSELEKSNGRKWSHRTRQLTLKRNSKVSDCMHKASRYIINQAVSNGINSRRELWRNRCHPLSMEWCLVCQHLPYLVERDLGDCVVVPLPLESRLRLRGVLLDLRQVLEDHRVAIMLQNLVC